jgi:hypothetical protein
LPKRVPPEGEWMANHFDGSAQIPKRAQLGFPGWIGDGDEIHHAVRGERF